jgi:hypothetical protein
MYFLNNYFKSLMNYKFVDTHTVPFCRQVDNEMSNFLIQGYINITSSQRRFGVADV